MSDWKKAAAEEIRDTINRMAEDRMLKTLKLEGAHGAALESLGVDGLAAILQRHEGERVKDMELKLRKELEARLELEKKDLLSRLRKCEEAMRRIRESENATVSRAIAWDYFDNHKEGGEE